MRLLAIVPFLGLLALAQSASAPSGLTAGFRVPRTVAANTPVALEVTVRNTADADRTLSLGRSNAQGCAFAPHVRVLKVGTREVVYPTSELRLCTQELRDQVVPAGGEAKLTRELDLPPGEYMVEGWVKGFADGAPVFLPGEPARLTVK